MSGLRAAALLALLAAPAGAAAPVKNPDTLTYATIGDIDTLDPAWAYDTASQMIIGNAYEYLVAFKGSSLTELQPRLASKVPSRANGLASADGRTYRFPIRKGVHFHDGSPLTPEDVRYSLLRFMLLDRDAGPSSLLLEPILGVVSTRDAQGRPIAELGERAARAVRVEGDEVVVRLPKPFAPFLTILANFGAIVSERWCAAHGAWDGKVQTWTRFNNPNKEDSPLATLENGSGPFQVERLDRRTKQTVLERYDGYWRRPAKLRRVVVKTVEEFATRKLMLEAGDADVIFAPQMMFAQLQGLDGVQLIDDLHLIEAPTLLLFTTKLNPVANPNIGSGRLDGDGIPPDFFADPHVRRALAYSIDYDAYIRDVMRGKGRPAHGYIPKGLLGYDPSAPPYRFDLAAAAQELKQAWGGQVWTKGFHFTVMFNDNQPNILTLANMIKKNVESLNAAFQIDVRTVQWSSFLEQSEAKKIPIFIGAWQADYPDPHNFAFPLLHSRGYYPAQTGFSDPKLDALIERAVRELEPAKRAAMYRQISKIAREETPSVPIVEGARFRAQRSWVKGWVFNPVFPDAPYGSYFYDLSKG